MTAAEIRRNDDVQPHDPPTQRARLQVSANRYLFGWLIGEHGFLSERGQVIGITKHMVVTPK
jgi:hypothetical protein